MENQLEILSESLDRKIAVLEQIAAANQRQTAAFSGDYADLEAFDQAFEEKDRLIDEMEKLDDGFETLYESVARRLQDNKLKYASQIRALQGKIASITDLSVSIQAQEARNKKLVEEYFSKTRNGIRQNRQTSKVAYDYYRNMSGVAYSASQFMDNKQ